MKRELLLIVLLSLTALGHRSCAAERPRSLTIRAGKIWTVTNGVITDGVIVIKNGKIDAVGENPPIPQESRILEMPDNNVIPGLIDGHCHLGLSLDVLAEIEETVSAVTPEMQVLDAFNPLSDDVKKALHSGVTTVLLSPGYKNPIAGQTAIVKLYSPNRGDWLLSRNAGVKFSLGNEALMRDRRPTSRPGLLGLVRDELNKVKNFEGEEPLTGSAILKRVAEGELRAYIYARTADEVSSSLRIVDDYGLKAILVGAEQGDEVASMIAERNIPVIYSPLLLLSKDKDLKRVGKIGRAGIKVAFSSASPKTDSTDLRTSAIIAVKYGLSPELALKGLTIYAAEILGIAERVGSIETGKDADLVILNGDPLELTSRVEMVIINGDIAYQREEK